MEKHLLLSDEEFIKEFENCSLNPEVFSHEAHLRLAWIYLCKYNEAMAYRKTVVNLKAYIKHLGAEGKFNHTLTIASVKAVYHFMQRSQYANFTDFINEFPELKYNLKELLATHYSIDIFNLPEAKTHWLEPDLSAF
ncbi:hypothetical protein DVK85_06815 [Flavobacterium arcticum]|uniref:Uncharacterized protein n=1 Tax=Flavobacterium arcticum TaxID=1784713 RepID=A0A345HBL1_9FLAO|nr:hypothetical protein [Flavobacterium arcticum]AXG73971.1 hypothetical protein DVK85_06815 [Flavobacterium arcticum]KAF2508947.1 hypothetical protein E0W72_10300 [Flavobacterium arcticum]